MLPYDDSAVAHAPATYGTEAAGGAYAHVRLNRPVFAYCGRTWRENCVRVQGRSRERTGRTHLAVVRADDDVVELAHRRRQRQRDEAAVPVRRARDAVAVVD